VVRDPISVLPVSKRGRAFLEARDVLGHLRKDHFGLGETCFQWYVCPIPLFLPFTSKNLLSGKQVYTKGEMSSHRYKFSFI
jgi:hypothetical protein